MESVPLACVPGAIPAEERSAHFDLSRRLFGTGVKESTALAKGYTFRFGQEALEDLARFVVNERKCCPFLIFELSIHPGVGPVWLTITGPEGTTSFLEAELPIR